jgi:hypothetical protein
VNLTVWTELAGIIIFVLSALLLVFFWVLSRRSTPVFRNIPPFSRLRKAVSLAVEDGKRVHFSVGRSSPIAPSVAAAFSGLSMLRQVGERTSVSDQPPVVTAGDSVLAVLGQDTLRSAYRAAGVEDLFNATSGRLSGLTPFSYAVGTIPVLRDESVSVNVLMGNFGVEVAFIADAAEREGSFILAGSDSLTAQAVLFATTPESLIGEELYAAGAYVNAGPMHAASLRLQDFLRWLIFLALLVGAGLKLVGIL